jgi:hypothetical protein
MHVMPGHESATVLNTCVYKHVSTSVCVCAWINVGILIICLVYKLLNSCFILPFLNLHHIQQICQYFCYILLSVCMYDLFDNRVSKTFFYRTCLFLNLYLTCMFVLCVWFKAETHQCNQLTWCHMLKEPCWRLGRPNLYVMINNWSGLACGLLTKIKFIRFKFHIWK